MIYDPIKQDLDEIFEIMGLDVKPEDATETREKTHGKLVDYRQEAYHDVFVYEDGHEEKYYIGD